jgi:O-acetylhomoserine/O-acetylserine sulfhydrylase-like pyridoxal-dependent enzyme
VLDRFGVSAAFVDGTDLEAVRAAIRPETTVLWGETLANPTIERRGSAWPGGPLA